MTSSTLHRLLLACLTALAVVIGIMPANATPPAAPSASVPVLPFVGGAATLAHDAAGQLVGVVSADGSVHRYTYDAAGNLTAVTDEGTPAVAALSVVPQRARAGQSVTVTGKGFSATPANNTVSMGGLSATVTASTTSTLTFTLPAASTGTASITSPSGSATTPTIPVLPTGSAPIISSFTPASAAVGDQVTITATGLQTEATHNVVTLNGVMGGFVSQTSTTITLQVPDRVGSGPIRLRTPHGVATSATDLRIVPAGIDPAHALGPVRVDTGVPTTLSVPAGKTYLATFPTTGNASYSFVGSTPSGTNGAIRESMYDPANQELPYEVTSDSAGSMWAEPNPIAGDEAGTVSLMNVTGAARNVTFTVHRVPGEVHAGSITLDGSAKTLTTAVPGQRAHATFTGTAGQRVSYEVGIPSTGSGSVKLLAPDGSQLASRGSTSSSTAFQDPVTLPMAGQYQLVWDPSLAAVSSDVVKAWDVPADVDAGSITLTGTAKTLATAVPGQQTYATFTGTLGQRIAYEVAVPSVGSGSVRLIAPDGTQVASRSSASSGPMFLDPVALPMAGTYKLTWDPTIGSVSSTAVKAWDVPADADAGTIATNGTAKTLATTVPGQQTYATFAGTAGQRIAFQAGVPSTGMGTLRLLAPDDTMLDSTGSVSSSVKFVDPVTLPTTGTYKLIWDPTAAAVSSTSAKAWDVPADANTGTISLDGTAKTIATTVPGQNAYATFTGTASQLIAFQAGAASSGAGYLKVIAPDGSQVGSTGSVSSSAKFEDPVSLPASGTYKLLWDPTAATISSTSAKAWDVPADADGGAIAVDGTAKTLTITVPGQKSYATFTGTAGQVISYELGVPSTGIGDVSLMAPDGTQLANKTSSSSARFQDPVTLPASGTYKLLWNPLAGSVSSVVVKAWDVVDLNDGTMPTDATTKTLTVSTPGQQTYATFAGSSGIFTVTVSASGSGSTKQVRVVNAAGTTVGSRFNDGTFTFTGGTGTFKILLDPTGSVTGSATVSLVQTGGFSTIAFAGAQQAASWWATEATTVGDRPEISARVSSPATPSGAPAREAHSPAWFPSAANLAGEDWKMHTPPRHAAKPKNAPHGVTALSGVVRDLDGSGVGGITVTLQDRSATTDATGRFLLTGVPTGDQVLTLDGTQATFADRTYGAFRVPAAIEAGRTTVLPEVWFPRLDMRHTVQVTSPLAEEVVLTNPDIPGLEVRIPAGSVIRDHTGKAVHELGITALPTNRLPYPMPAAQNVPIYFTVQPGGATIFPTGASVIYPNYTGQAPGTEVPFVQYTPQGGWETYGKGRVSDDGRQIRPDQGTTVWSMDGFSIGIGIMGLPGFGWFQDFFDWMSGDPVELSTGKLSDTHTDLAVDDVIPIELTRHHWQGDGQDREFGTNTRLGYDWYLNQTTYHAEVDLYLPTGGMVHFSTAPNPVDDVDLIAVNAPPKFEGARLVRGVDAGTFELRLRSGDTWCFPYQSRPRWMRDKNGNQVTFVRPSNNGILTRIMSPGGRWIAMTYDGNDRVTSARDHAGRTVSYTYDTAGRLATVTDPAGEVRTYTYDGTSDRIETITDARNVTYLDIEYDTNARVSKQTLANGAIYEFDYTLNGSGKVTQTDVTLPTGSITRYEFDGRGQPTDITEAFGTTLAQTTTLTRATTGRVDAITDDAGRQTEFTYDTLNRRIKTTILAGTTDERVIDERTYGIFDQPTAITDADGEVTEIAYDADGDLASVTDPANHTTTYATNTRGQTTSITTHTNKQTTLSYTGNAPTSVTDPLNRTTSVFRDTLGRPVEITDAAGNRTSTAYDVMNNPLEQTDALGRVTEFEYDENGHLTTFTDARQKETSWVYDDAGNPTSMTDPLLNSASATYDPAGRITSSTERSGTKTAFTYDALDRLKTVRYGVTTNGEDSTVTATYDTTGRLASVDDTEYGTTTYGYSAYDEVLTETSPDGEVTWTYDQAGRPASVTNDELTTTSYSYDEVGQLDDVTEGTQVTDFTYNADGLLTSVADPGGWTTATTYDAAGQITDLDYAHNTTPAGDLTYTYSKTGMRQQIGGTFANITDPTARSGMVYDDANRLTTNGSATLTYDDDGNLTNDGTTTYTWDPRGQLSGMSRTGLTGAFDYDDQGRRRSRTVNSETRTWLHNGANPAVEKTAGDPTAELGSVGVDGWHTRTTGGVTDTYLTDALGSPVALGRSDGTISAELSYDPFGVPAASGDQRGSDIGFTGRQDDGTGLMYYRARYYNPALGRFISEDPIGHAGGTNLYGYVGNSPSNAADPSGNVAQVVVACAAGAALDGLLSWGTQRMSGQKVDWGSVGKAAAAGCVFGAFGYGLGAWMSARFAARAAGNLADACRANSFTGETRVLMANGAKTRIKDVKPGDRVMATDPESGEAGPRSVRDLIRHGGLHTMVEVRLSTGTTVDATDRHPFWVQSRGAWVHAMDLRPGDVLLTADGDRPTVERLSITEQDLTAYNLTVAGMHTYHVGRDAILVHNCAAASSITSQIKRAGLTSTGSIRFVPPKGVGKLARGPNHGYIDRFGNEWTKGPSRTPGDPFEWDVIPGAHAPTWFKDLAKDGTHVNISLGGVVTH